jgi:hypothetical protein
LERRWAERQAQRDDVLDVDDPRTHKEIVREEKVEELQPFKDPRDHKMRAIAKMNSHMEITKSGYVRSDKEIAGIRKKKIESRKKAKKLKFDEFSRKAKERDVQRRLDRAKRFTLDFPSEEELRKVERKVPVVVKTKVKPIPKKKFEKSERLKLRKMNDFKKKAKKARKKKRQAERKSNPQTESFVMSDCMRLVDIPEEIQSFVHNNRYAMQCGLFITQMCRSRSASEDALIVSSFVLATYTDVAPEVFLTHSVVACALSTLSRRKRTPVTEALSDDLMKVSSAIDLIYDSEIFIAVRNIVLVLMTKRLLDIQFTPEMTKWIGGVPSTMKKATIPKLVSLVLGSVASIVRVGEYLHAGVPLCDILKKSNPLKEALLMGRDLERQYPHLYYGLPVEGGFCAKLFVKNAREVLSVLEYHKKLANPLTVEGAEMHSVHMTISGLVGKVETLLLGGARPTPYGVVVVGEPGIGKSSVVKFCLGQFSAIMGRKFDHSHVFERNLATEYWDGYDPISTPYVHYSEVGSLAKNIAKQRGDPAAKELTSVVDSLPYRCNMSDVKDKGVVPCRPEMVIIDTNNDTMNFPEFVSNPAAYMRRFLFIEPHVKEEYRKEGSFMLDPRKDSIRYYDKWTFRVFRRIPTSITKWREDEIFKNANIDELAHFLRNDMKTHMFREGHNCAMGREDTSRYGRRLERKEEWEPFVPFAEKHAETEAENLTAVSAWKTFFWNSCDQLNGICESLLSFIAISIALHAFLCERVLWLRRILIFFVALSMVFPSLRWISVMIALGVLNMDSIAARICTHEIRRNRKRMWNNLVYTTNQYVGYIRGRVTQGSYVFKYAALAGVVMTVSMAVRYFLDGVTAFTESSTFPPSEVVDALVEREKVSQCGKSYKRVPVNGTQIWNTRIVEPSKYTGALDEFRALMNRNLRICNVSNGSRQVRTHCFGVCGNIAIVNRHALVGSEESCKIRVYQPGAGGQFCDTLVNLGDCPVLKEDLVLVSLDGVRFRDFVKHFPEDKRIGKHMAMVGTTTTMATYIDKIKVDDKLLGTLNYRDVFKYQWDMHTTGMCGIPLLARADIGCCILGIHSAGSREDNMSYAIQVLRSELQGALDIVLSNGTTVMSEARVIFGGDPHFKSPIRYEVLNGCEYYGAISDVMLRQKSKMVKTVFAPDLDLLFWEHLHHIRGVVYVPPLMQPRGQGEKFLSPWNVALRKMCKPKKPLDSRRLSRIEDCLFDRWCEDMPELRPLDMETAINGVDYDAFIRRINMSTAAGFGTPGKKKKYFQRLESDGKTQDVPEDSVIAEVLYMLDCYSRGECVHPMFTAQLKDEPRDRTKVAIGKTRVFFSTAMAFLIVQRMFLAPFYTLMVEKSQRFGTAVGIDMHRGADELYNRIKAFSEKVIEGDYSGYDTSMPVGIGRCANRVVVRLLAKAGYNTEALTMVTGILGDLLYPHVSFLGESMCFPGLQPSGKYGTAEDNSLRNIIIQMYVWDVQGNDVRDFFDHVLPVTYGDDVLMAVRGKTTFNTVTFAHTCEEHMGLKITTPDKGEVTNEYISPDDMTFLKRNFRYHPEVKCVVAPLDLDSIYKSLEWRIPSSFVNEETQMEQTTNSALREIFFHTRKENFELIRDKLLQRLEESYKEFVFEIVTHNEILESLCPQIMDVSGGGRQSASQVITESLDETEYDESVSNRYVDSPTVVDTFGRVSTEIQWPAEHEMFRDKILALEVESKELGLELEALSAPIRGLSYRQVKRTMRYTTDMEFRKRTDDYFKLVLRKEALDSTIRRLWAGLYARQRVEAYTESEVVSEMKNADLSTATTVGNVTDVAGQDADEKTGGHAAAMQWGQHNKLDMRDFLTRPLTINSMSLTTGTDLTYSVDIWDAFLDHPSVRAKIRNFAYIRGTLHVRIAVSGTPFHYGRLLVSYQPLASVNKNLEYVDSALTTSARWAGLTYLSQARGAAIVDVRDNKPVDIECPFISPQPMLRLFNESALILPEGAAYNDAVGMGRIYLTTINQIRSASPTPTPISIFIYAWMTDVDFGAPTGTVITVGTESEELDERKVGPVERIATRASEFAEHLTSVPIIAPYARASGLALRGVSSLAALFGFSKPTMINEPVRMRPQPFQNGAQTIGYGTEKRITLDPKQELSVDPRIVGIEEDDMSIAAICSRESLLDTFDWTDGTAPLASSIWMAPVNPGIVKRIPLGSPTPYVVAPTALAFAAAPFEYWRGTITFRFEIVCSAYHRGKLAFYFEPNIAQNVVIDTVLDMNKQYIKVVDIQKTQEVTLCVNWAFPKAWARNLTQDLLADLGDVGFLGPDLFDYANGYIAVTPFTALQSPDGSDVSVNVYIKSDDMMFNQLTSRRLPLQRPTTESKELAPVEADCMDLNESDATVARICEEHFGEVPVSFRGLLKRFVGIDGRFTGNLSGDGQAYTVVRSLYPPALPKYDGVAIRSEERCLFTYLRYAYLAMRGGMKFRHYTLGRTVSPSTSRVVITLDEPTDAFVPTQGINNSWEEGSAKTVGSVCFAPTTNAGVEFAVPFYSNNLFGIAFSDDFLPATLTTIDPVATRGYVAWFFAQTFNTDTIAVHRDFAIDEDFSFMRFQGAPIYTYV